MRFFGGLKHYVVPTPQNAYRPHLLGHGWLLTFLALSLMAEGFLVANLVSRQSPHNFLAAVIGTEIISLTNTQRQVQHLGTLREHPLLAAAAKRKAEDMVARGYFAHTAPDGKTPWQWLTEVGYDYRYAGENLAVRFIDSSDVVAAWMNSPSHRANIVKAPYTDIGVAVVQGLYQGRDATYVVQFFGSSRAAGAAALQAQPSPWQSVTNQFVRVLSEPRGSVQWVLGSTAALLIALLSLAFFLRIHVQPTDRLVPGAIVALVALALLTINGRTLSVPQGGAQSASTADAVMQPVVIDPQAYSTVR